jgi:hypothetical protein
MLDSFLQRSRAKLAVAELLGFLDRWIRRRLREITDGELWMISRDFHQRCRDLVTDGDPKKTPSMGALYRMWAEHPFKKYLDEEQTRRVDEMERSDPERYWGMHYHYNFSKEEADDFIDWCYSKGRCFHKNPGCHTLKEHIEMWKKTRRKILPVMPPLPKSSLPSNVYGQRPSGQVVSLGKAPAEAEKETNRP